MVSEELSLCAFCGQHTVNRDGDCDFCGAQGVHIEVTRHLKTALIRLSGDFATQKEQIASLQAEISNLKLTNQALTMAIGDEASEFKLVAEVGVILERRSNAPNTIFIRRQAEVDGE